MYIESVGLGDAVISVSKISPKRQVVIPEDICKKLGARAGDFVEFVQREDEVLVKLKKLVDADMFVRNKPGQGLPPAPNYEERMRMLKEMEGNAEDDTYDIPLDEIKASRVNSDRIVKFD